MKPNTVGAVLRGDPTSTRTLTAIAAGFGVGVAALLDGGAPEPADPWTAALEHLDAAGRTLAAAHVDATPRPELTPDAAADVERAALAAHRALKAIGEAAVEVRVGRALSAFVRGAEPAESLGSMSGPATRLSSAAIGAGSSAEAFAGVPPRPPSGRISSLGTCLPDLTAGHVESATLDASAQTFTRWSPHVEIASRGS